MQVIFNLLMIAYRNCKMRFDTSEALANHVKKVIFNQSFKIKYIVLFR